jgi:hypothetical protein
MVARQDDGKQTRRISLEIIRRAVVWLAIAFTIGWALNHLGRHFERDRQPAGFGRGFLQGALMPMAMPNLAFGSDVNIYAMNNTGVRYKLGYTAGVNACGMLFFGFFFWRVRRWRVDEKAPVSALKD